MGEYGNPSSYSDITLDGTETIMVRKSSASKTATAAELGFAGRLIGSGTDTSDHASQGGTIGSNSNNGTVTFTALGSWNYRIVVKVYVLTPSASQTVLLHVYNTTSGSSVEVVDRQRLIPSGTGEPQVVTLKGECHVAPSSGSVTYTARVVTTTGTCTTGNATLASSIRIYDAGPT